MVITNSSFLKFFDVKLQRRPILPISVAKKNKQTIDFILHRRIEHCKELVWYSKVGSSGYQARKEKRESHQNRGKVQQMDRKHLKTECRKPVLRQKMKTIILEEKIEVQLPGWLPPSGGGGNDQG